MRWCAVVFTGVLAGAGCAGRQKAAESPTARRVASAQNESQKALDRAAKAQERATEQADRVAQAERDVREAQRRLAEAQHTLQSEQQKAERLQQEAIQAREQATVQAESAQREATRALAEQGRQVQRQQQAFSGQVTRASANAIVVTPPSGEPMTFKVTDATQVQIDGRRASAADVRQGADARVSYQTSGAEPTAVTVQVITGARAGQGTAPSEPATPPQR